MHNGPLLTLRAIFSLMMELGPEFFRGKPWVSVMSSSSNRMLRGTVRFPSVHLCLSSFTWAQAEKTSVSLAVFIPGFVSDVAESERCRWWIEALPPPPAPASWDCGRAMKNSLPTADPLSWSGSLQTYINRISNKQIWEQEFSENIKLTDACPEKWMNSALTCH